MITCVLPWVAHGRIGVRVWLRPGRTVGPGRSPGQVVTGPPYLVVAGLLQARRGLPPGDASTVAAARVWRAALAPLWRLLPFAVGYWAVVAASWAWLGPLPWFAAVGPGAVAGVLAGVLLDLRALARAGP